MLTKNWDDRSRITSIISRPTMEDLYSKAFIADFRANEKFPAYNDGSTNPFDYDVLTSSQDGCPITGLKTAANPEKDGVTDVKVTFHLRACDSASKIKTC